MERAGHEDESEIEVMLPQPRNVWGYQKLEKARKDPLVWPAESEYGPGGTLILNF